LKLAHKIQQLIYGHTLSAIEVGTINGSDYITLLKLNKTKGAIELEEVVSYDMEHIEESDISNKHYKLIFNTDTVITKSIVSEKHHTEDLVSEAFPGVKLETIYYNCLSLEQNHIISICKKSAFDSTIAALNVRTSNIIEVFLGPQIIYILKQLSSGTTFHVPGCQISFGDTGELEIHKQISYSEQSYSFKDLELKNNQLLAFGGALSYEADSNFILKNYGLMEASMRNIYLNTTYSKIILYTGLFLVLIALLVNFLFYSYYFSETSKFSHSPVEKIYLSQKIKALSEINEKKAAFIANALSAKSYSSYYLNEIIKTKPVSIVLDQLSYQPIKGLVEEGEQIEYETNVSLISGQAHNAKSLSEWIRTLEELEFIDHIFIENLVRSENEQVLFKFKIKWNE
jgi:hypothetical protein